MVSFDWLVHAFLECSVESTLFLQLELSTKDFLVSTRVASKGTKKNQTKPTSAKYQVPSSTKKYQYWYCWVVGERSEGCEEGEFQKVPIRTKKIVLKSSMKYQGSINLGTVGLLV